jgi:hypothetical protein
MNPGTAKDLQEYAELDGTEWGEAMTLLCQLQRYEGYINDKLFKQVQKEIKSQLAAISQQFIIVEDTETFTRKFKRLEPC